MYLLPMCAPVINKLNQRAFIAIQMSGFDKLQRYFFSFANSDGRVGSFKKYISAHMEIGF